MSDITVNGQPIPLPDLLRITLAPLGARDRAADGSLVQEDRGFRRRVFARWVCLLPDREAALREVLSRDPFFLFAIPAQQGGAGESMVCCLLSYESELTPAPGAASLLVRQAQAELLEK